MSESAIKSNQREAQRLYERGVAAARSGQRRMAAVLLSRAVQLDPRHEHAWLWLSGTMDDPERVAFCLRSVLSINPHNQRAQQGLAWLEQRRLIKDQAAVPVSPSVVQEEPEEHAPEREAWWVKWRQHRREMRRAWVFVWVALIVPWVLLLGLHYALRDTVERNIAQARAAAAPPTTVAAAPTATLAPVLDGASGAALDARVLSYLSVIAEPREQLRTATQQYREQTSKPGNGVVIHAAAARTLRDQIEASYERLAEVEPPPALEQAHTRYLAGLKQQQSAMDDMLEFYGTFSVQYANRATLRLLDAGKSFDRAKAVFQQYQMHANDPQRRAAQSMR